ncbi:MAG TPA: aminopeptidase P N-terminal domain-containing protein [Longimicrobiales bacterium]
MTEAERQLYAERRARVLGALGEEGVLVVPAAPELLAGRDTELRYHPDPDLLYLTGYEEPQAVLVLAPGAEAQYTLFVRPRDAERELWTGRRGGVEAARESFGADAAHSIGELDARLPALLAGRASIYAPLGARPDVDVLLRELLLRGRAARQRSGKGARALFDPGVLLDDMRLLKDEHEIALLREAARITVESFRECAAAIRPGAGEWEVQAVLESGFRRRGAQGPAFESIVAAGENATVLHYIANDRQMQPGELLLVDAGASWRGYAGDITRTFPVSGRFSAEQRAVYDAVLAAQAAGIQACRPGAPVEGVHRAAVRALVSALVEQGLLRGAVDELVEQEQEYKPYYPHKTSHWLGLDVHDVGDYARAGAPRPLQPGMVLTVEPGLYFPATAIGIPDALRAVGVRIEDDVLITADGAEVLTGALPVAAEEVEALLGG